MVDRKPSLLRPSCSSRCPREVSQGQQRRSPRRLASCALPPASPIESARRSRWDARGTVAAPTLGGRRTLSYAASSCVAQQEAVSPVRVFARPARLLGRPRRSPRPPRPPRRLQLILRRFPRRPPLHPRHLPRELGSRAILQIGSWSTPLYRRTLRTPRTRPHPAGAAFAR